jgi:hypothetical protein
LFTNKSRATAWFDTALPMILVKMQEAINMLEYRWDKCIMNGDLLLRSANVN